MSENNSNPVKPIKLNCGSCKSPLEIFSEGTKFKRCDYCGFVNYIVWKDPTSPETSTEKILKIGKFKGFGDFKIGNDIKIDNEPFKVIGALRYSSYDGGWYEFLVRNIQSRKEYWISYEEGNYKFYDKVKRSGITRELLKKRSGETRLGTFRITEKGKAKISSFGGEIPFIVNPKEKIEWWDGIIGGKLLSVEAVEDEFEVYVGSYLARTGKGLYSKSKARSYAGGEYEFDWEASKGKILASVVVIVIVIVIFGIVGGPAIMAGDWSGLLLFGSFFGGGK